MVSISILGWDRALVMLIWTFVLMAGLIHSFRKYAVQPHVSALVAVACILELFYINERMMGGFWRPFTSVLPVAVVQFLMSKHETFLHGVHLVAWSLVLLAISRQSRERYLVEDQADASRITK